MQGTSWKQVKVDAALVLDKVCGCPVNRRAKALLTTQAYQFESRLEFSVLHHLIEDFIFALWHALYEKGLHSQLGVDYLVNNQKKERSWSRR